MNGNGQEDHLDSKSVPLDEPWKRLIGVNDSTDLRMDLVVSQRDLIKNRADAPHVAVIMPIGNKVEQVVQVRRDGTREIVDEYRQPGLVPVELMLNQMQLTQPLNVSVSWLIKKNNISSVLRDTMTENALEMGVNFIFYWDDDVLIPPNTWYRMLNHMAHYPDIGAITGVVWTRVSPVEPILYKHAGVGAYWGFSLNPEDPPEDIHAAGAGCLMVRTEALRRVNPPYWIDERNASEDGSYQGVTGHDIRFMKRLRDETGYRVCVDGSIQCHHFDVKSQKLFMMPEDMPSWSEARRTANDHAKVDEPWERERSPEEILGAL